MTPEVVEKMAYFAMGMGTALLMVLVIVYRHYQGKGQ